MAINRQQLVAVNSAGANATSVTATLSSTQAGSLIVVVVGHYNGSTVTSITDNQGNTYVNAGVTVLDTALAQMEMWYAVNATGGVTSVTVNIPAGSPLDASFAEYTGVATSSPIDVSATKDNSTAGTSAVGASVTTTIPGGVVIGVALSASGAPATAVASPFTLVDHTSGKWSLNFADDVTTATGTFAPSFTLSSSSRSACFTVAFAPVTTKLFLADTADALAISGNDVRQLSTNAGASVAAYVTNTVAGAVTPPTTTTQWTKTAGGSDVTWVTPAVSAVTLGSGSVITFNLWAKESANQANATITAELLRLDSSGNVLATIAPCLLNRAELTTTIAVQSWTATLASAVSLSTGDRLAIRCHLDDGGGVTMASGRNCTLDIGGATAGADGDSYVIIPAGLLFVIPVSTDSQTPFVSLSSVSLASGTPDEGISSASRTGVSGYDFLASLSATQAEVFESSLLVSAAQAEVFESLLAVLSALTSVYSSSSVAADSTSYSNPCGSGNRYERIDVTTDVSQSGTQSAIFNGLYDDAYWWGSGQTGKYFQFDFMEPRLVTEITWYQSAIGNQGTWKVQGSNNGSTYIDIGSSFTLGAAATTVIDLSANATAYQFYKMVQLSGTTTSGPFIREVEFKIDAPDGTSPTYTGALSVGNRTSTITVTSDATMWGGTVDNVVDGAYASNATDSFAFNSSQSGKQVTFQFQSAVKVTEAKWIHNSAGSQGTWKWQGSNDGSTWTDIGTAFTLGATRNARHTELNGNTSYYTYYRLQQTSGVTSNGPWIQEVFFKLMVGSGATSVSALVASAFEALLSVSNTGASRFSTVAPVQSSATPLLEALQQLLMQAAGGYESTASLSDVLTSNIESTQLLLSQITEQQEALATILTSLASSTEALGLGLRQAQGSFESSASAIGTEGTAWESQAIGSVALSASTPIESAGTLIAALLLGYESLGSLLQQRLSSWESLSSATINRSTSTESISGLIAALVFAYESEANNAVATPVSVSYEAVASLIAALTGAMESQVSVGTDIVAPLEALQAAQLALSTAVEAAGLVVVITGSGHEALAALSAQQTVSSESLRGLSQQLDSAIEALSDLVVSAEIPWAIAPSSIIPSFVLTAVSVSLAMLAQAAGVIAAVQAEAIEAGVLRSAESASVYPVMTFESLTIEPIEAMDSVSVELETGVDLINVLPDDEE